ncbi:MAG: response regulator [Desulfuromonadales bacterium]|jgi:CheY-like chemotaxis protein
MSLVGNLEDLGLGEILQIVSLSRKSGVLELSSRDGEGRLIFHDGQVIRATSTAFPENLGDLVLRAGIADMASLKQALRLQQEDNDGRRIGDILVDEFGVNREALETAVRAQVEKIVYSFFSWDEGSFSFELSEPRDLAMINFDPLQFMLDQGINPQWLAMEGSRILDEKRHRGDTDQESGSSQVDAAALLAEVRGTKGFHVSSLTTRRAAGRRYLIIDDDPATAEQLAVLLQSHRVAVHVHTRYQSFLAAAIAADPATTTLVIDLIMPRRDGSGVLGGLELLEAVRRYQPGIPVLMMTDQPSLEAEKNVASFEVAALLIKPKPDMIDSDAGREQLSALVNAILAVQSPAEPEPATEGLYDIAAELRAEIGETAASTDTVPPQTPGLHLLRGMLQELNNPSLGGGIILLILRFASELMNRAVILLVKDEEIVGLGQFGIECADASPDTQVRSICLPKQATHVFSDALQQASAYQTEPEETEWNDYLFEQLGGARPEEVFIGPLLSEGRVVALLYGDNLPDATPIGDTESLEIFLSQAGLAMEKALLERRMMSNDDMM